MREKKEQKTTMKNKIKVEEKKVQKTTMKNNIKVKEKKVQKTKMKRTKYGEEGVKKSKEQEEDGANH